jgi:uncharacterized protein YdhG (YjbR/CyaY superfamily)
MARASVKKTTAPKTAPPKDVDAYIAAAPPEAQSMLREMRRIVRAAAPTAEESISYGIIGYKLNGPLVYFGASKKHCGFHGTTYDLLERYADEVAPYRAAKGTLRFKYGAPLPLALVEKIVRERVKENEARGGL